MTNDLNNLDFYKPYTGPESVKVGDGASLPISHIGQKVLHTSLSSFILRDVLVVPQLSDSLISICRFTLDNSCDLNFDSVKDHPTQTVLTCCNSWGSLYPFFFHDGMYLDQPYCNGLFKSFSVYVASTSSTSWSSCFVSLLQVTFLFILFQ